MPRTVRLNLAPLRHFQSVVERDLRLRGNGPIRQAIRQWAARYRGFARARFDMYSKGGGDWKPLSPSTIARRRKGVRVQGRAQARRSQAILERRGGLAAGGVAILRDTSTLFGALDPHSDRKPGQLTQDIPFGVRVGFGGPALYPGGKATIADIARFHDQGLGRNPQRQIIVEPDQPTVDHMADDMRRGIRRLLAESEGKGGPV